MANVMFPVMKIARGWHAFGLLCWSSFSKLFVSQKETNNST